ncbi:hypothetical protein P885DRAFT_47962 [Corynascus similis CBS 632.67]
MADIYTPPPDFTYLLLTPFDMPTDSGSVRAVAFSSRSGALITAALSVAFTVIFICFWNFLCFVFIALSRNKSLSRYVALVTLWNSNDSWFAFKELASYSYHYLGVKEHFWYGLTLAILAFCVFGITLAIGIVGPSLLQIGTVAPVRPSSVYYPVTPQPREYVNILKEFGLRAPGVLRALGSVEAAKVTMRSRVSVDYNREAGMLASGEPIHRLTYDYRLNGVEFGLQQGASLELVVQGACVTEYSWYAETQTEDTEVYYLWGNRNYSFPVPIDRYNIQDAPKASFLPHPDAVTQYARDANTSFAIVVWSAHRASITEGADPWYATEPRNSTVPAQYDAQFWMRRARPTLSCWEQNSWSWAGQPVRTVSDLKNTSGIKVPQSLLSVLEAAFTAPVLIRLGNASGDSALRSRTTSPNGVIDASASNIYDDLERLILASFVASRNVFVDAIMFEQDGAYPNLVEDATGQPAAGAGDFVVSSPSIQTFSLYPIVAIVVILVVLLIAESAISFIIKQHQHRRRHPSTQSCLVLFKALTATQLFRRIYELRSEALENANGLSKKTPRGVDEPASNPAQEGERQGPNPAVDEWQCHWHFPAPRENSKINVTLDDCDKRNGKPEASCRGHVNILNVEEAVSAAR